MNRKEFLKTGAIALGTLSVVPIILRSEEENLLSEDTTDCVTTPSETAGPFRTKNPASLQITDIRADRKGVPLNVLLTVQDANDNCAALPNAIVDIWHCDKDGYYSEYGGMRMQRENFTAAHFLRGRQISNKEGQVGFTSIFPGWYRGRAPHIHVEVFNAKEQSLLVTQIAFPDKVCNTVYTTAAELYTRGLHDTPNSRDNIFANSLAAEMADLSGEVALGFQLKHTIVVEG